jgi:hypothetical protein
MSTLFTRHFVFSTLSHYSHPVFPTLIPSHTPHLETGIKISTGAGAVTTTIVTMSRDPLSDSYLIDVEEFELGDGHGTVAEELLVRTVSQKNTVTVPIIDQLPHLEAWSPRSDISSLSTSSSPTQESFNATIQWTNADLSTHPDTYNTPS